MAPTGTAAKPLLLISAVGAGTGAGAGDAASEGPGARTVAGEDSKAPGEGAAEGEFSPAQHTEKLARLSWLCLNCEIL